MKKRLDLLLVEKGYAPTRQRAQSLIMSGQVLVQEVPQTKAGALFSVDAEIRVRGQDHPYVSRGGVKLAGALDSFNIVVEGKTALDVGASTGGFTHVLILRGIKKVYAVDVGHSQLDWKIRSDSRVVVHEKVNARHMEYSLIGEKVDLIVVDVSFISLEKIFPALLQFTADSTDWVTLIKPQFEVGKDRVGKGGLVRSDEDRKRAIERLTKYGESLGVRLLALIESPITGTQGNIEYLAHWKRQ
ncbi:MAG: TlyA family RNA methyltransferase [Bdellovibrionota bacterium]